MFQRLLPFAPLREAGTVIWHRHWFVLVRRLFLPAVLLALLVALLVWSATVELPWLPWALLLALVCVGLFCLWQYVDWWNDIYVLTEDRLVDVNKVPLFFEEQRAAPLDRVQDVTFVLPSFLHKLLHMGDITVETAGKLNDLTFLDLYDPQAVRDEIFQRMDLFRRRTVEGAAQEAVLRAWRQQEHEVALRIAQLLYDQVARVGGRGG
jgi:uncharacterized membrane protein YdbT with pleckstrin-like domain